MLSMSEDQVFSFFRDHLTYLVDIRYCCILIHCSCTLRFPAAFFCVSLLHEAVQIFGENLILRNFIYLNNLEPFGA